jgi:hypothetical protein
MPPFILLACQFAGGYMTKGRESLAFVQSRMGELLFNPKTEAPITFTQ